MMNRGQPTVMSAPFSDSPLSDDLLNGEENRARCDFRNCVAVLTQQSDRLGAARELVTILTDDKTGQYEYPISRLACLLVNSFITLPILT